MPVLARMEERGITVDRQILSRLSGELAQGGGGLEDEIYAVSGRKVHYRLAEAAWRYPLRQDGACPAGRKTKTGQWSTSAQRAGGSRGRRPRTAAQDRRLAPADQAEVDLYGRLAGLSCIRETKRVHTSYALAATTDGATFLIRPQPAEHPGAHRRKAARSAPPSSPHPGTSWFRPTTARSSCACLPMSPTSRSCARPLPMASTFTR